MNQPPETTSQTDIKEQRNAVSAVAGSVGQPPVPEQAKPQPKTVALKSCKLPQIFRRLSAIGFNCASDGRYVNSSPDPNIQEIAWGLDRIEDNCVWLFVSARKPFAYAAAAMERFAQLRQARLEQELRLAKEYWLGKIQPRIAGRILRGVEFFVAQHDHWHLQKAVEKAGDWNRLCAEKKDGVHLPVSVDVDLSAENFREPVVPEMLFADNVKPETLAVIAAPLMKKSAKLTPVEAIRNAHELLMAAERYIGTLPEKAEGTESFIADFDTAFSTVTFAEIEASNRKTSGQLPLLPPIAPKRKGRPEQEIGEQPLSVPAIRAAVKHFLDERTPRMSQEQYEREQEQQDRLAKAGMLVQGNGRPMSYQEWQQSNQDAIDDCLKNNRISLQDLCTMRWERFKKNSQDQQNRAIAREAKKAEAKTKAPKTKLPKSAASSPSAAGKRQK